MHLARSAPARPASAARRLAVLWAPALPAIAFLAVFFVVPVLQILQGGFFTEAGTWDASQFQRLITAPVYVKVLWTTFGISLATAVLSVALGYPLAYWLGMMTERSRGRWVLWIMLPFWTSYLVKTYAWMLLLSRTGLLTTVASLLGLTGESGALAPSLLGVLVGMVHAMLPLAVLTILPTMQGINRQLSSAAEILGAGRATNFLTVFFPLSLPGVAAAGLLVFITCLGFFIVPALLGTPRESMIAQLVISSVLELVDMRFAGALSIVILLCSIVVFYVYDRLVGLTSLAGEASQRNTGGPGWAMRLLYVLGGVLDKVFAAGSLRARRAGVLAGYCMAAVGFLVLPILIVIPIAFTRTAVVAFPPQLFSLRWFVEFIESPVWQAAMVRSLAVGAATAVLAVVLGFGATYTLTKVSGRWVKPLFALFVAPLIVPRIVVAIGLLYLFASFGMTGSDLGLVIGHTILAIPYVVVTLSAGFRQFDWRLDDAARILGASMFGRLRTVLLPLLAGSITSALLFAFIVSFDDLTIAIFVSGGVNTTLPKQMWDSIQLAVTPTLAAVSTFLVLLITVIIFASSYLKTKGSR